MQEVNFDLREPDGFLARFPRPFDGQVMRARWKTWRAYVNNPLSEKGDFFDFVGTLGLRPIAQEKVGPLLESAGELLPIEIEDEGSCSVFNCTTVLAGAFDSERGTRRVAGKHLAEPTKYAFLAAALEGRSVFKIPEQLGATFIVRGGSLLPERDLFLQCEQWKLKGLTFNKLWTEEIWR